jgi:hypothetical protein
MGSWSENVGSWTGKPNRSLFVMRYEDMLAHPLQIFGELADWLGLRGEPAQLRRAIELSSFAELKKQEAASGFKEKPQNAEIFFREGKADQWKSVLTRNQIRRVLADHREQMVRFGYAAAAEKYLESQHLAPPLRP